MFICEGRKYSMFKDSLGGQGSFGAKFQLHITCLALGGTLTFPDPQFLHL